MHLSLGQYLAVAAVLAFGAFCQGTVGFGMNLIAAPVVGLVAPELMPASMVVVGVPMSIAMARRERAHIDWRGVGVVSMARLPGTALGAWLVAIASDRLLGGIIGGIVIAAVLVSIPANDHDVTDGRAALAGGVSGFMDTAAATGGPPIALLYQHRPAAEVRSTLAAVFLVGTAVSIGGLAIAGQVAVWQLVAAAALLPAVAGGLLASHALARRTAARSLRPAVLLLAGTAGAAAVIRSLVA